MLDWSKCPVPGSNPDKVSGAWVFRGTRVPVSAILRNLTLPIDELPADYPSVSREQVEAVLISWRTGRNPAFESEPVGLHVHS